MLLLAGGGAVATVGSVFNGTIWSAPATISGAMTSDELSLAVVPATGEGVGLVHTATNELEFTIYNGTTWSSFAQLHTDTTQGAPSVVGNGATAHAVYWGTDFMFYYESFSGSAWATASPAILPLSTSPSLCGPVAPALAAYASAASFVFVNGSCSGTVNALYGSDLVSGVWQATANIAAGPSYAPGQHPAVTAPSSGPQLVAAYVAEGMQQIYTAYRTATGWSTAVLLTNGLTNDPVALAPVTGGGAVMAYRGTDNNLYTSFFSGTTWSVPVAAFSSAVTLTALPSVARGIGSATAEMAYVDGAGALWHTRYIAGAWTAAKQVGTASGFAHVAIGSGP